MRLDVGSLSVEVLIDTGFSGSLIIPGKVADNMDLKFEAHEEFLSATGAPILLPLARLKLTGLAEGSESPLHVAEKSAKLSLEVKC